MQPLNHVITALRREIEMALADGNELPRGARLEAERIVLSLRLAFQEQRTQTGSVEVVCGVSGLEAKETVARGGETQSSQAHTLTIEFKPPARSQMQDVQPPAPAASAAPWTDRLEGSEAERVIGSLTTIFGAPGFDSSARATVFRETIAGLSDAQVTAVVVSLSGAPLAESDPAAEYARHLIRRLLERSEAGVERGRDILAEILERYSAKLVSNLIEETWKTQDDWLDE